MVADRGGFCPIFAQWTSADDNISEDCADGLALRELLRRESEGGQPIRGLGRPDRPPRTRRARCDNRSCGSVFLRRWIASHPPFWDRTLTRTFAPRTARQSLASLFPASARGCAYHRPCPPLLVADGTVIAPLSPCRLGSRVGFDEVEPPGGFIRRIGGRDVRDSRDRTLAFPVDPPGDFRGWCPGIPKKRMNCGESSVPGWRSTTPRR